MYRAAFAHAGLPEPEFVDTPDELDAPDRLLANALSFHLPYTCTPKTFDRTHTEALVGSSAMAFPTPEDVITALLDRQIRQPARFPSSRNGPNSA